MPTERKGAVIRVLFSFGLIGVAIGVALWIGLPEFGAREEPEVAELTAEQIEALRKKPGCVVVIHSHEEGNEDSERTQKILDEIEEEERYKDLVTMGELDIEKLPEEARKEGVTRENAPQLSFYIEGTRVGEYRGPWHKEPVQRKIDEVLRGYMARIGKDWRPPVPGMERMNKNDAPILEIRRAEE